MLTLASIKTATSPQILLIFAVRKRTCRTLKKPVVKFVFTIHFHVLSRPLCSLSLAESRSNNNVDIQVCANYKNTPEPVLNSIKGRSVPEVTGWSNISRNSEEGVVRVDMEDMEEKNNLLAPFLLLTRWLNRLSSVFTSAMTLWALVTQRHL